VLDHTRLGPFASEDALGKVAADVEPVGERLRFSSGRVEFAGRIVDS
jgi:hypothetical protein